MKCAWLVTIGVVFAAAAAGADDKPAPRTAKEGLQVFNDMIGSWRCTGTPEGTQQQKRAGFWTETLSWEWQFKKKDVSLRLDFDQGKNYLTGNMCFLPANNRYQLRLQSVDKHEVVFEGALDNRVLTLERADANAKETQRLVFTFLHENRFLYHYEVKPEKQANFSRRYQVGATKEGVAFAGKGDNSPECIVSGGLGTIKVIHKGKEYYVCCTGCRDAFKDEPEKYIQEYEQKKKK